MYFNPPYNHTLENFASLASGLDVHVGDFGFLFNEFRHSNHGEDNHHQYYYDYTMTNREMTSKTEHFNLTYIGNDILGQKH